MRFRVRHLVSYSYDAPVALGPHVLRLTPRGSGPMAHGIRVTPEPALRLDETDPHGNRITRLGFTGKATELVIEARFELDTAAMTPPDLPAGTLPACLTCGTDGRALAATAERLRALAGPAPDAFAGSLAAALHGSIHFDPADRDPLRAPGETLARGRGSARDIAALFVELSRRADLPARFVSGYWVESAGPGSPRGAHVWAEVLLPGLGWRGYDPARGVETGEGHLALAAAPDLAGTLPVSGSTFGSTFGLEVRVRPGSELTILTPG